MFGSLDAAVATLRGEPLGISPATLDFGSGKPGEMLSGFVTINNYSSEPVRLIGGTSDCSCITTQDMPLSIPPGESATLRVLLKVPAGTPGQMTRRIELFTDCPQQHKVALAAGCRVWE